jgi:hypothetical protein
MHGSADTRTAAICTLMVATAAEGLSVKHYYCIQDNTIQLREHYVIVLASTRVIR